VVEDSIFDTPRVCSDHHCAPPAWPPDFCTRRFGTKLVVRATKFVSDDEYRDYRKRVAVLIPRRE
jgi:hypothetical protein